MAEGILADEILVVEVMVVAMEILDTEIVSLVAEKSLTEMVGLVVEQKIMFRKDMKGKKIGNISCYNYWEVGHDEYMLKIYSKICSCSSSQSICSCSPCFKRANFLIIQKCTYIR